MDSDHESEDDLVIDDTENNDAPTEDGFDHGEGDADDNVATRVPTSDDPHATGESHQPLRLQPHVLDCRAFDIIPYVLAVHPCNIYCLAATQCMRWVFTGSEDGYVRKYDFFASMNGKTPLTQGQRHGQVDSVTKAGILTSYWENEEQPLRTLQPFGIDGSSTGATGAGPMDIDMTSVKREGSIEPGAVPASSSSTAASGSAFQRAPSPEESKMSAVYSLDCHSEAIFALSGLESGSINLWTPRHEEGTCHHVFRKHTGPVSCLKLTPDQRGFVSGSWDHNILQWDLENGAIVREYSGHGSQISSLSFQPNGMPTMDMDFSDPMVNQANDSVLMSTSVDGMISFWDRRDPTPIPRKLIPPERVPPWALSACWTADGSRIFCGRRNGTVDEWNFADGRHVQTIKMPANSGPVSYVKCLPNNKHLICASQDNIRMWNVTELDTKSSLRPFQILAGHHGGLISAIHIDPTCRYMVTTSGNREWEGPSTNACLFYDIQTLV